MRAPSQLDALVESLSNCFNLESAQRVIDLPISAPVHTRIRALSELANEGHLGLDERDEYAMLLDATGFISTLKLKLRRRIGI